MTFGRSVWVLNFGLKTKIFKLIEMERKCSVARICLSDWVYKLMVLGHFDLINVNLKLSLVILKYIVDYFTCPYLYVKFSGQITGKAGEFIMFSAVGAYSPVSDKTLKGQKKGIKHILLVVVTEVQ